MAEDRDLNCRDCGNSFIWTARDQDFFATKGFNQPSRCPSCRASRKNSNGGGNSESRPPAREMFDAHCNFGNHDVRVPFQVDTGRSWDCRDHKEAAKAAKEASMHDAYCATGAHIVRVPFVVDGNRPWACKAHKEQAKAEREASLKEVYCDANSHWVKVPLSFNKDDSRPFQCLDCKRAGIELPRYTYTCSECPATFTTTREMDETRWLRCPQCRDEHRSRMDARQAGFSPMPGTGTSSSHSYIPGIGRVRKDPGPGSMNRPQQTWHVPGIGSFPRGGGGRGRFG